MVCYCCVKGCNNNSNIKKKDPNYMVSFHAFPTNPEMRSKWLRAIGRPNWEPMSHTRICSVHFNHDQISHGGCRTRIKDDACPVNALPLNSNFEASHLEVCRICLATDLKMYNLEEGILKTCMESIGGFSENHNIEGLPQFVCYECAAHLIRFYHLVEKSVTAQATMLDIFAQHGQITESLIRCQDRKNLNLLSNLNYCEQTNNYQYIYDYENNISSHIKSEFDGENTEIKPDTDLKRNVIIIGNNYNNNDNIKNIKDEEFEQELKLVDEHKDDIINFDDDGFEDVKIACLENNDEGIIAKVKLKRKLLCSRHLGHGGHGSESPAKKKKRLINVKAERNKLKVKSLNGLTPDEINMQEYFDIVKLSLQEQIDEWQKSVNRTQLTSETIYRCQICSKVFAHINTFRMHSGGHDSRRGSAECPVCKLRFKNEVLVKSHRNRTHGKKFYCKSCPKVFNNVAMAKKHHRWHNGHLYNCTYCPFNSAHESSLRAHTRTAHASHTCATCGRACSSTRALAQHCSTAHGEVKETGGDPAFRCEQCDINFVSEGARRVHVLTSRQHKAKQNLCGTIQSDPSIQTNCSKCGVEYPSLKELIEHMRSEHRRSQKKTSWSLPGDSYPSQCEHCSETVNNRKEHWWHVRKQHPKQKHLYKPVITAICETCGKGFQNCTKLQLHELRHSAPRVPCPACARVFYDKYALARHATLHGAARAHQCTHCHRTFRLRASLHRHARVHTAITPYECTMCDKKFKYSTSVNLHVRTVHYKLPHPPRKKRSRPKNYNTDINNENDE